MIDNILAKIGLMAQSLADFLFALPLWIKIAATVAIVLIILIITLNVIKNCKIKRIEAEKSKKLEMLDKSISNDRKEEQV